MKVLSSTELVAYHEAGHAVIACALDIEVKSVSIDPGIFKSVNFMSDGLVPVIALAGPLAVNYAIDYYADKVTKHVSLVTDAQKDDGRYAMKALELVYGGLDSDLWNETIAEAKALIKEHWNAIDITARRLMDQKTLSHDDVARAIWPWLPDDRQRAQQLKFDAVTERHKRGGQFKRLPRDWRGASGRTIY